MKTINQQQEPKQEKISTEPKQITQEQLIKRIPLTIQQIKEHMYCPRFTYWREVHKHKFQETYKMRMAKAYHKNRQKRITRKQKTTTQNQFIHDHELNLTGLLDITQINTKNNTITPVEIKFTTNNKIPATHYMQLLAQAYLLEKHYNTEIKYGEIKNKAKKSIKLPFPKNKKQILLKLTTEIREVIYYEILPEPTPTQAKCRDCEHKKLCNRV